MRLSIMDLNPEEVWFSADPHYGHKRVIEYCKRPFSSIEEMDKEMIARWNDKVKPSHNVFLIGDFSFYNVKETKEIINQLNGTICLIVGNHDKSSDGVYSHLFDRVLHYAELKVRQEFNNAGLLVLCHYPFRTWNKMYYGSWNLHGHCHGTLSPIVQGQLDVGVDNNNFSPINLVDIQRIMRDRTTEVSISDYGKDSYSGEK